MRGEIQPSIRRDRRPQAWITLSRTWLHDPAKLRPIQSMRAPSGMRASSENPTMPPATIAFSAATPAVDFHSELGRRARSDRTRLQVPSAWRRTVHVSALGVGTRERGLGAMRAILNPCRSHRSRDTLPLRRRRTRRSAPWRSAGCTYGRVRDSRRHMGCCLARRVRDIRHPSTRARNARERPRCPLPHLLREQERVAALTAASTQSCPPASADRWRRCRAPQFSTRAAKYCFIAGITVQS